VFDPYRLDSLPFAANFATASRAIQLTTRGALAFIKCQQIMPPCNLAATERGNGVEGQAGVTAGSRS